MRSKTQMKVAVSLPPIPFALDPKDLLPSKPESFILFSQPLPSRDLGMVDPKASTLDITIAGRDLTIEQSPSLLASSREGGTTGAGKPYSPTFERLSVSQSIYISQASISGKHG